ncbi:hypothetical protein [Roseateles asaccharophilus]|uniref:hypothetical protein n=1 Tax=Roseateles asaccharophilus TaxID=582607 RepID=UPI00105E39B2|nr:hypothetical protein [Roseateles asaccharophilus]
MSTRALMIGAGVAGAGLLALYVSRQGLGNVAASVGAGAVQAVGGAASGAVGAIGQAVGLPTPAQTSTDAQVARWLIDNFGQLEASKWAGAPAYLRAQFMDAGSGRPPPADSAVGLEFLPRLAPQASYDETDRLAARYPAPREPSSIFDGGASFEAGAGYDFKPGGIWGF